MAKQGRSCVPATAAAAALLLASLACTIGYSSADEALDKWYAPADWEGMFMGQIIQAAPCGCPQVPRYGAYWTDDCNLVLARGNAVYWSTHTGDDDRGNRTRCTLLMQRDGNLVIYDNLANPIWASQSMQSVEARYYAQIQTDGNLVIYSPDRVAIWASQTEQCG